MNPETGRDLHGRFHFSGSTSMKRILTLLSAVLLACLISGCGNDKDKGVNKDKDRPRPAPSTEK